MSQRIIDALLKLDVNNDDHWTDEGLPRLDAMKDLLGETVSRVDVTNAAKGFTRKTTDVLTAPNGTTTAQAGAANPVVVQAEQTPAAGVTASAGEQSLREFLAQQLAERKAELDEAAAVLADAKFSHGVAAKAYDEALVEYENLDGVTQSEKTTNTIFAYLAAQKKMAEEGQN